MSAEAAPTMVGTDLAADLDTLRALAGAGVPVFLMRQALDRDGAWVPDGGTDKCGYWIPSRWQHTTADPAVIDRWRAGMGAGMVTGHGLDVLDVDPRHGGDVTRAGMVAAGLWPDTYAEAATPSGGTHELVSALDVASKDNLRPGLDVKAGKLGGADQDIRVTGSGFVFLAPTVRLSKVTGELVPYTWTRRPDLARWAEQRGSDDSGHAVAEMIRAARDPDSNSGPGTRVGAWRPAYGELPEDQRGRVDGWTGAAVAGVCADLAASASWREGQRDDDGRGWEKSQADAAYRLGALARAAWNGLTLPEAEAAFLAAAPTSASWTRRDVQGKWNAQHQRADPAAYPAALVAEEEWLRGLAESGAGDAGSGSTGTDPPEPAPDALAAFWAARPVLSHLRDSARARRAAPWAVLGAALARVVVATPPSVVLPALVGSDASLNLFVAIVGASGDGKGAALGAAADALYVAGIGSASVGSGEGLTHLFVQRVKGELIQHTTALLVTVGEVDTLAALNARQGATLQPVLRQAFMGEAFGFGYADPTKRLEVAAHSYRLALVVSVQPKRAGGLLDDADGGTPQRFLWLPATDAHAPDIAPELPPLQSWTLPALPEPDHRTGRRPVPVCDTARVAVDTARLDRMRGKADALDGHAVLTRLKVGAALSLLDGRIAVSEDDWTLAGVVMAVSDAARGRVVAEVDRGHRSRNHARAVAEADRAEVVTERAETNKVNRVAARVHRKISEAGADGVTGADLRRRIAQRDRHLLDDALTTLTVAGSIVAENLTPDAAGAGGNGRRYRISGGTK